MDWPLSHEEKKRQVLQLYDREEQMTDSVLLSGHEALARMKAELETIKHKSKVLVEDQQDLSEDSQRLFQALEAASAVFRAVVPSALEDDCSGDEHCGGSRRAKSAGATRSDCIPPRVASKKPTTPRSSLKGAGTQRSQKPRVSFGAQPESSKEADVSSHSKDLSDAEAREPEPRETSHCANSERVAKIADWGLTEFCVPSGTVKLGIHFRLPPEPLFVHGVTEGSWAEAQGICEGDAVYAVAGKRADSLTAAQFVRLMLGRPLKLTIERLPTPS